MHTAVVLGVSESWLDALLERCPAYFKEDGGDPPDDEVQEGIGF